MSKSKQGGSGRAVALQYGPGSGAPVIVASGMGHLAEDCRSGGGQRRSRL